MSKPKLFVQITIGAFMLVTVFHVTAYASSFEPVVWLKWLGLLYALAVELSIVVSAYFTRWSSVRAWAWTGFFLFTAASGVMNWGWIEPDTFDGWIYALFPTTAIALLGFLYRQVDANRIGVKQSTDTKKTTVKPVKTPALQLSDRQRQIVKLVNTPDLTKVDIASQLSISRQTLYNELNTLEAIGALNGSNQ